MLTLGIRIIGNLTTVYSTFKPIIKRSVFLRLCNTGKNENLGKLNFTILKEIVFSLQGVDFDFFEPLIVLIYDTNISIITKVGPMDLMVAIIISKQTKKF
jgi:hypothetical protein